MKNCDSKLRRSAYGNNHTNFPNPPHAARSRSFPDVAIQFVTNLTTRGISAGITAVPAVPVWPLAAAHARRLRSLRKSANYGVSETLPTLHTVWLDQRL